MSELVTFTEVSPPDPVAGALIADNPMDSMLASLDGTTAPQGGPAVHCGVPMQLVTPAVGRELASYTFAPTQAASPELPPVWRCACGFQLDAWRAGSWPEVAHVAFPA